MIRKEKPTAKPTTALGKNHSTDNKSSKPFIRTLTLEQPVSTYATNPPLLCRTIFDASRKSFSLRSRRQHKAWGVSPRIVWETDPQARGAGDSRIIIAVESNFHYSVVGGRILSPASLSNSSLFYSSSVSPYPSPNLYS